jgi:hypothetical protein
MRGVMPAALVLNAVNPIMVRMRADPRYDVTCAS